MSNRIISPEEFSRHLLESLKVGASVLDDEARTEFYKRALFWLSGGMVRVDD